MTDTHPPAEKGPEQISNEKVIKTLAAYVKFKTSTRQASAFFSVHTKALNEQARLAFNAAFDELNNSEIKEFDRQLESLLKKPAVQS